MKILLVQLDGKLPNLALMRLAAWHRRRGDSIELRRWVRVEQIQGELGCSWDRVFGSALFERSRPLADALLRQFPHAVVGGTGIDPAISLEDYGVAQVAPDYSIYPTFQQSIGFTQRGCRLRCPFCVVPKKEGRVRAEQTIAELWRGEPWPRELVLLDNDFFGQSAWPQRIEEMRDGNFKVSFCQGINARALTEGAAAAIASVEYRDDQMRTRRIYTAWDSRGDERRLFRGLELLVKYGVKPDHIMVYMLVGYWPGETAEDREYRRMRLRKFGCRPYPMPFVRTPELVGFQRWVVGAYDKRVSWGEWTRANYEPRSLGMREQMHL